MNVCYFAVWRNNWIFPVLITQNHNSIPAGRSPILLNGSYTADECTFPYLYKHIPRIVSSHTMYRFWKFSIWWPILALFMLISSSSPQLMHEMILMPKPEVYRSNSINIKYLPLLYILKLCSVSDTTIPRVCVHVCDI